MSRVNRTAWRSPKRNNNDNNNSNYMKKKKEWVFFFWFTTFHSHLISISSEINFSAVREISTFSPTINERMDHIFIRKRRRAPACASSVGLAQICCKCCGNQLDNFTFVGSDCSDLFNFLFYSFFNNFFFFVLNFRIPFDFGLFYTFWFCCLLMVFGGLVNLSYLQ